MCHLAVLLYPTPGSVGVFVTKMAVNVDSFAGILLPGESEIIPEPIRNKIANHIKVQQTTLDDLKVAHEKLRLSSEQQCFDLGKELQFYQSKAATENNTLQDLEQKNQILSTQLDAVRKSLSEIEAKYQKNESLLKEVERERQTLSEDKEGLLSLSARRLEEIDRLSAELKSLSEQLASCQRDKREALVHSEELHTKELNLEYREKRFEQEKSLFQKQMQLLQETVEARSLELAQARRDMSTQYLDLQNELSQKSEELRINQDSLASLTTVNRNQTKQIEDLSQRLRGARDVEAKMEETFRQELRAQTKLAELYKNASEDAKAKSDELSKAVLELQNLLREASSRYGQLEAEFKEENEKWESQLTQKNEALDLLRKELKDANLLIEECKTRGVSEEAMQAMSPAAAAASKWLKSGLSLTQLYTQYVSTLENMQIKEDENRRLNTYIDQILKEIEERAPGLVQLKEDYDKAVETVENMGRQLDAAMAEATHQKMEADDARRQVGHLSRDQQRLQKLNEDMARQVRVLLREVEELRGGFVSIAADDTEMSANDANPASQVISQHLVTFRSIEELQKQNQQLLGVVRELSDKQEALEIEAVEERTQELKAALDKAMKELDDLRVARRRQESMVETLVQQRDMYKMMVKDANVSQNQASFTSFSTPVRGSPQKSSASTEAQEEKIKLLTKMHDELKEAHETYRQERKETEKMLQTQLDQVQESLTQQRSANAKLTTQLEFAEERFKISQGNAESYKRQIAALEEKNKNYNAIVVKHEHSITVLKDETLKAQQQLSQSQVALSLAQQELQMVKESEQRLRLERESLHQERKSQSLFLANLEAIRNNLEHGDTATKQRLENQVDSLLKEGTLLRKKLEQEAQQHLEGVQALEKARLDLQKQLEAEREKSHALEARIQDLSATGTAQTGIAAAGASTSEEGRRISLGLSKPAAAKTPTGSSPSAAEAHVVADLRTQLLEARNEVESLKARLESLQAQSNEYRDVAQTMEDRMREANETLSTCQAEMKKVSEAAEAEKTALNQAMGEMKQKLDEAQEELKRLNADNYDQCVDLKRQLADLKLEMQQLKERSEEAVQMESQAKDELQRQVQVAADAQAKYERELMLHATDMDALNNLRQGMEQAQTKISELEAIARQAQAALEGEKGSWKVQQESSEKIVGELRQRNEDLERETSLLQEQLVTLSNQLTCLSQTQDAGNRSMNTSLTEDEPRNQEQLLELIKFLRRDKEIALTRFDAAQGENQRLKAQVDQLEKQVKELEELLRQEREKLGETTQTATKHGELLRKLETLNALTDSNRLLREERDSLQSRVELLTQQCNQLQEKLGPLEKNLAEANSKTEALTTDNQALKADVMRWREHTNRLIERVNKSNPEEQKRLMQEKEACMKQVTQLTEQNTKLQSEVSRLSGQIGTIQQNLRTASNKQQQMVQSMQAKEAAQQQLNEERQRLSEEVETLKKQLQELQKELTTEKTTAKDTIAAKENEVTECKSNIAQLKKIARNYKTKFEELKTEHDKLVAEKETAAQQAAETATASTAEGAAPPTESTEARENLVAKCEELEKQVTELKSQLDQVKAEAETLKTEAAEREEKTRNLLKGARQKLSVLTTTKDNLTRELEESRARIESAEQGQEEANVKMAALRSQLEGRIARLERENAELLAERERLRGELDTCSQRVPLLQRQVENLQKQLAQPTQSKPSTSGTAEKPTEAPPTANIRPMSSPASRATPPVHAQASSSSTTGGLSKTTPTASIRPMALAPARTVVAAVQPTPTSAVVSITPTVIMVPATGVARDDEPVPSTSTGSETGVKRRREVTGVVSTSETQSKRTRVQGTEVAGTSAEVEEVGARPSQEEEELLGEEEREIEEGEIQEGEEEGDGEVEVEILESERVGATDEDLFVLEVEPEPESTGLEVEPESGDQDNDGMRGEASEAESDEEVEEGGNAGESEEQEMEEDREEYEDIEEEEEQNEVEESNENSRPEPANGGVEVIDIEDSNESSARVPAMPEPSQQQAEPEASSSVSVPATREATPPLEASTSSLATSVAPAPLIPAPWPVRNERLPSIGRTNNMQIGFEEGDDSIVPSTPVLLRPRANEGFAEAVSSPHSSSVVPGGSSARFVFGPGEVGQAQLGSQGMDDTRMDLGNLDEGTGRSVPSTPLQRSPPGDLEEVAETFETNEAETGEMRTETVPSIVVTPATAPAPEPSAEDREREAEAAEEQAIMGEEEGESRDEPTDEQQAALLAPEEDPLSAAAAREAAPARITRARGRPRGSRATGPRRASGAQTGTRGRGNLAMSPSSAQVTPRVPIVWESPNPEAQSVPLFATRGSPQPRGTGRARRSRGSPNPRYSRRAPGI